MSARNILRLLNHALKRAEKIDFASGEKWQILPVVDDQGSIEIGDGTNDMDFKVFLGTSSQFVLFDVGNNKLSLNTTLENNGQVTLGTTGFQSWKTPVAVTANTTISSAHYNGITQSNGSGALIHTLPAPAAANDGAWVKFVNIANQDLRFNTTAANTLIALNDITASGIIANTANTKLGAVITFVSLGADGKWVAIPEYGTWTVIT